jgi:hypothetical protein
MPCFGSSIPFHPRLPPFPPALHVSRFAVPPSPITPSHPPGDISGYNAPVDLQATEGVPALLPGAQALVVHVSPV